MTHPFSPAFTAAQPQRNRRLLLALPACALPVLSACGGGADLSYGTEQALYVVGEAITPNNPQLTSSNPNTTGATAPTFSVSPALPAGLALNAQTGVISGTPTKLKRQASHTVTARNNRGAASTQVRVTVTGRGAWSSTATVPGERESGCIAPLPGGNVLVAGGMDDGGSIFGAHIYDAAAANWTPAPGMRVLREHPMCIALRDGRVLFFGGTIYTNPARPADLYDPVANKWFAAGSMVAARTDAASCLLPDGKVLVTGGGEGGTALDSVELYAPGTGTVPVVVPFPGPGGSPGSTPEPIPDPGTWTLLPKRMSDPRQAHAVVLLPGGKSVLLVGGSASVSGLTRMELYPLDGSASTLIPSPVTGQNTQAAVLDDGSVLIVTDAAVSWRFYPRTSTWKTSTLMEARQSSQMVLLADGRVLRAGGVSLNTAEIYNPDVNLWTLAAPMAVPRMAAMAALLGNGRVLMVGGRKTSVNNSTELYTP